MPGYTKLFSSILMSSIWEEPDETRLVWIAMLALADQDGHVDGTVKSLARVARVPVAACDAAIRCLLGPDRDDRSGVRDGRRIVPEPGGWGLVNYATYRAKMSAEERKERDRIRKRNARMSVSRPQMSADSHNVRRIQQAEAEAEAEAEADVRTSARKRTPEPARPAIDGQAAFEAFAAAYPAARRKRSYMAQAAYTQALAEISPQALLEALANHLASEAWADPRYVPNLENWLLEKRWRDTLPPKGTAPTQTARERRAQAWQPNEEGAGR